MGIIKYIRFVACGLLLVFDAFYTSAQIKTTNRNWLSAEFEKQNAPFAGIVQWREQQRANTIAKIKALPDSVKAKSIKVADEANTYNWPSLPATLYLDYKHTGTRVNYEKLLNERRQKLSQLVIGELITGSGKYIPQIVNGLWLVLEESTWVAPAHVVVQKAGADLPDITEPYIDLGASATGALVAQIYNLLYTPLGAYSKVINKRIELELNRRIFAPYLKYNHFWWMGFNAGLVNNWNIFNNTNCLQAALLAMRPSDSLNVFTRKILSSADKFLNNYPDDGGCDEGPSYWDMAGGKLIRLLTLLNSASGGKMSWTDKPLIHDMGTYIYKMHIADSYMVNFADAVAHYTPSAESVYRYGAMFNDMELKQFAAFLVTQNTRWISTGSVLDFVQQADIYQELTKIKPAAPYTNGNLLNDLQVFTTRAQKGSRAGLFFAAKGGNNAESHNHNDIGNFIVYIDGKPVIIDAGVGTYTAQTFSNKRYELWNLQSQWHNCPTINGVQQMDGRKYAASGFKYIKTANAETLQMDIAAAYPTNAAVQNWQRDFNFQPKSNQLTLTETYRLKEFKTPSELNFITPLKVTQQNGILLFGNTGVKLKYDPTLFNISIEEKEMDDERIRNVWGKSIYRIKLTSKSKALAGKHNIIINKN